MSENVANNILNTETNKNDSDYSILSIILFTLFVLAIVFIFVYYFWYTKQTHLIGEELPTDLYDFDDTIISIFEKVKNKYGSYPAMKYKDKSISYTDYWNNTELFSQKLLYFIGPHPRVAIMSFNSPKWFYTHMGTMMSNGISVGIYPTASSDIAEHIINHSCVDLLVVENLQQLKKLKKSKINSVKLILVIESNELNESTEYMKIRKSIKEINPNIEIMSYDVFTENSIFNFTTNMNTEIEISKPYPEDIATIIYTSGTTGKPKGVVQTHHAIMSAIKNSLYAIRSRSTVDIYIGERYISYLPLNHIAAQMMDIYIPIFSIGSVTFADSDALKGSLKDTIKKVKPTIFIGVPRVWEKMEEVVKSELKTNPLKQLMLSNKLIKTKLGLDQTKYCISAASPISDSTRKFFKDIDIEICNIYGMSETCGAISMGVPGSSKGAGIPLMDVKIDKDSSEILVRGSSVFKKYYKDKKNTKDAFAKKKWFKTGDTGHIDRSGYLHISGRIKDLIITSGGENISPIPIEEAIVNELKNRGIMNLVKHVIVIGNNRKFISLLVFSTDENRIEKPWKLENEIESIITKVNKHTPNPSSTIKKHLIIDKKLKIGETLTPILKICRNKIDTVFKKDIDWIYNPSKTLKVKQTNINDL
jgi:long-chain-fatty-acid--CoA ligase ACSBG